MSFLRFACLLVVAASFAVPSALAQNAAKNNPAACAVEAPKGANATEKRVWASICAAGFADLSALDQEGCDATSNRPWPPGRELTADFIRTIFLHDPWRKARGAAPLQIRCATILGALDLSHRQLPDALLIEHSRFTGVVSLAGSAAQNVLSWRGARLDGGLHAPGLRAEGDVFLRDVVSAAPVRLRGARLSGALEAQNARFVGGIALDQARLVGPARLSGVEISGGGADFTALAAEGLDLRGARLGAASEASLRGAVLGRLDIVGALWPAARDFRGLQAAGGDWLDAPGAALIAWLESGFSSASGASASHENQSFAEERAAYLALAEALRTTGRKTAARAVRMAERRRYLSRGGAGGLSASLLRLWGLISGFGHQPERVLFWGAALALLGALMGAISPALRREGAVGLLRLSVANAFQPFPDPGGRARLARAGAGLAALFGVQRVMGAGLLTILAYTLALRAFF